MYEVQMQYIPGSDQIWVAHLSPNDPIYQYPTLIEAEAKAFELENADPTGRKYRVVEIS
jgi:hypothetical protein